MKNIIRLFLLFSLAQNLEAAQTLLPNNLNQAILFQEAAHPGIRFESSQKTVQTRSTIHPELADSLQSAVNRYLADLELIGLSVAIDVEGDTWAGTAGINTGQEIITPDLNFPIGSVSKTITAATILHMYEEGLLDLEDVISTYLPSHPNIDPNITIRQLLNHTSGIYNYDNYPSFSDSIFTDLLRVWTPQEVLDYFVDIPDFSPGTSWGYSNTNYLLIGLIIETISGNEFHVEAKNRVLSPNGFDNISLYPQEAIAGPSANVWVDITGIGADPVDFFKLGGSLDSWSSTSWATGGYVATPTDIVQWIKALFSGQILSQSTLDEVQMIIPIEVGVESYLGYGLGAFEFNTSCAEASAWGHGGDIFYSSQVYHYPAQDITIGVHSNDETTSPTELIPLVEELHCIITEFKGVSTSINQILADQLDLQVSPNPFSEQLQVQYELMANSTVSIDVYNSTGQLTKTIFQGEQIAGQHSIDLEVNDAGIYWLVFRVEDRVWTKQVVKI